MTEDLSRRRRNLIAGLALLGSTLVRQINAGEPPEVWCRQLLRWDKAGGRTVRGLTLRRQAEYRVCIGESED